MGGLRADRIGLLMFEHDTVPGTPPTGFSGTALIDGPWALPSPGNVSRMEAERDLAKVEWPRPASQTVDYYAMQGVVSSVPWAYWVPCEYIDYGAAHALVRAGCGSTILPSMAMRGVPLDNTHVTQLPGFGFRRIFVWHRKDGDWENGTIEQVLATLLSWATRHHKDWREATG